MEAEAHYRRLERLYHSANIQQLHSGSTISVGHGHSELALPVHPAFFHGAQALHGAVYFKLLDDAAYFAAASVVRDLFIVTASFQLNLLRPISQGSLRAVGTLRSRGGNLLVAEAALYNERGKEVAFGTGQFMRSRQPWEQLSGYAMNHR
jgi:uncharacterized protein (TIGR00369 family)